MDKTKTITLTEEVSPEEGLTKQEIENGVWNSPPAEKNQGRYLLVGAGIDKSDFAQLKKKTWIWYWDSEFLEDCDMFYEEIGWRINLDAIKYLIDQGYKVDIFTLENQKKKRDKQQAKAESEAKEKVAREDAAEQKYRKDVKEYEAWLGNPIYRTREPNEGLSKHLKTLALKQENYEWGLTTDNHIFLHRKIMHDWWDNIVSVDVASDAVISEANRLEAERAAKRQAENDAWELKKKQKDDFARPYLTAAIERAGGFEKMAKKMKKAKTDKFTPWELTKDGKPEKAEYRFSICEAKRIVGES